MGPSDAKDHPLAASPPGSRAAPPREPAGGDPRPGGLSSSAGTQQEDPSHPLPGAGEPHAVDRDVPGAVRRVLGDLLSERTERAAALDPVFAGDLAERVARFALDGGKLMRPRFVWWALRACGGGGAEAGAALRIGAALELIQTCALVHDDVMDGSPLRRGRLALHADVAAQYADGMAPAHGTRFGEAAAILAGDLALAWADDIVADTRTAPATDRVVRELWSTMRTEMVAGQYLDIQGQATSSRSLARAIRAACLKSALYSVERPLALGAALAGADAARTQALCSAGRCVGIAFQLRDDLGDVFGGPRHTGKPTGGDIRAGKPTYLVAVAQARAEAAGDRRALILLRQALGNVDLSENGLAEVGDVIVRTGARDIVEAKIARLVTRGLRHLESAPLEAEGRLRLRELLHATAGSAPTPPPSCGTPGPVDVPVSLLLGAVEGAAR
ncbi:polyprenyl synthetase family protein [Streptomyces europaeiscabiei]|uniref:polyprenyl synthetase family protein n=1 Tax=Streptomyces TaxID=1883 RepID=UPI000A37A3D6|nr:MULTISPECIES: polyprenyl synthetase family protein [Streptomyces]MDX3587204.1 polyprenyl synthetase family protein [Streptomyces europaeiscabiei]MDX3611771.1 polyprenyl synthetase family protein [Streptomyces europaeiscabiei]MDX3636789.1 polyprenyl synthetase family protein [Streptomyces europaeiscabiei]MDX3650238.1 polyprenyl synthetase family protein [Streptomyces europaeiscabiei]